MTTTPPAAWRGRSLTAGALAAAFTLLAGCAALTPLTPEQEVTRLAEKRWDALIKGDFPKAYDFTQPGFRAIVKREQYAGLFGSAMQWKAVQIHDATCEAERCKVTIRLTSENLIPNFARRMPEITGYIDETWIRDQGRWWYYQNVPK